jgi:hypothetical protein
MESLLGEEEVSSLETSVSVRKGYNVWSDRWIGPKFLQEFSDSVFLGVDVESLLSDAEGSSIQTRVAVRKSYNFLSKRWITLKFYRSFRTLLSLE